MAFNALFFLAHDLPATVPVAAAMLVVEGRRRLRTWRHRVEPLGAPA
jgi:hypothetical protein